MSHQAHVRRVSSAYWISRAIILFVYAFAIACIVILAIAFFLQLFNANQTAPFVDWTYRAAKRIMQPFRGIFPPLEGEQGSVFDVSMLFAIFMYGLLALGLHAFIAWIDRRISSLRYESTWQPVSGAATGRAVAAIPAAAPAPPPAVSAVTSPPPDPSAASQGPPSEPR